MDYTIHVKRYAVTDPRLGRHVRHDSRSLAYAYTQQNTLRSIRHEAFIAILDQGNLGSCTGNAATAALCTGPAGQQGVLAAGLNGTTPEQDEQYAVGVYSAATALDNYAGQYPPDDTGSDGLSVAKVLKARGLISGYQHALSLDAVLSALAVGPVIVGTEWRQNMFQPAADGRLTVAGSVAGGHEYCLDELDVENRRVWLRNSWGEGWGVQGRAYLGWNDLATLLAAQGDCTVFVPAEAPAPTPTPPTDPTDVFALAVKEWLSHPHASKVNCALVKAAKTWLASRPTT